MLASGSVDLSWHPHPSVWVVMAAVAVAYWYAFTRLGPRVLAGTGQAVATTRQRNWIITGLVFMYVFAEYPIHDISERYLFSVHMVQHTVFTLVAPACLLLGTPDWLTRWVLSWRPLGALVRFAARPLVALLVFNALIAVTHWPVLVEKSLHNELVHFTLHFLLFSSATLMWFPVINRVEGYPRMGDPVKMMYIFAQSIVPTVPASFITFSKRPVYETYAEAPRLIRGLSPLGDQQIAAAIMKVWAGGLLWAIIAYIWFNWYKKSQADGGRVSVAPPDSAPVASSPSSPEGQPVPSDVLTWEHVKAELDALEAAERSQQGS